VVVALTTTEAGRVAPGSRLVAGDRTFVVVKSRPHQKHHLVFFEGVTDRNAAEALQGTELRAEAVDDDPDALWVHELVGAEVVEVDGTPRGTVEAVQANPASDLLVLDSGALVPLRFVVGWDERPVRLRIDPPAGLFELG
jgi:16S rRNA processing protein RimM